MRDSKKDKEIRATKRGLSAAVLSLYILHRKR